MAEQWTDQHIRLLKDEESEEPHDETLDEWLDRILPRK